MFRLLAQCSSRITLRKCTWIDSKDKSIIYFRITVLCKNEYHTYKIPKAFDCYHIKGK